MGFFGLGGNKTQQTQQFGAPNLASQQYNGYQQNPYGMQQPQNMGMGGLGMMQQAQNPMMQQAANDPIVATSQLLNLHDPISQFIISGNMALVMDLIGEIVMLSIKEFFTNTSFITDDKGAMKIDTNTLPNALTTLSAENLALTLQKAQGSAQNTLNQNEQQIQMFLAAHQQGYMQQQMMGQEQPGFFGSMLGGIMGNAVQNQGGFGATMGQGVGMAAKGAAIL
tara:strand:- start:45 stop:716 length:672 start_codon:yes stop_codon:yes gene_type:complete